MTWHFTPEIAEQIIEGLENGLSLSKICRTENMPSRATVNRWFRSDVDFEAKCAAARARGQDVYIEKTEDLEDDVREGRLDPQSAKVILSSIQWRASKLAPKRYGDKQEVELSGKVDMGAALMERLARRRAKSEG